jgi:hypothetical protein
MFDDQRYHSIAQNPGVDRSALHITPGFGRTGDTAYQWHTQAEGWRGGVPGHQQRGGFQTLDAADDRRVQGSGREWTGELILGDERLGETQG